MGLSEYFVLYNSRRPHQSLQYKTPDVVYASAIGGGAMIIDKYEEKANAEDLVFCQEPNSLRETDNTALLDG